ncbi:MAG: histidine phosphatase family protein [Gammaproteobacteria bacterium]
MVVSRLERIYFIRHGETAWSLTGQHTGSTDLPLTAHGEAQARALAPWLKNVPFTRVLTSALRRARQTCELAGLAERSEIDPQLAECDYGEYEGRRTVGIQEERPGWNVWRDGCPGGETPAQLSARADRVIDRLTSLHGAVAVFSHGQFGEALAARWIGLPTLDGQHFVLDPASLSILGYEPGHSEVRVIARWNSVPGVVCVRP